MWMDPYIQGRPPWDAPRGPLIPYVDLSMPYGLVLLALTLEEEEPSGSGRAKSGDGDDEGHGINAVRDADLEI